MSEPSEDRKKLVSGVLDTALLDEIAERLLGLQEHFRESSTEGFAEPREPVVVTAAGIVVYPHTKNWFSVSITNDGPNNVDVMIFSQSSEDQWVRPYGWWHSVLPTEVYNVGFTKGQIKAIQMRTAAGQTATVRIVGVR